jgi:VIT1/CCC1 family predicted Fe2+/Mn2+ transporter
MMDARTKVFRVHRALAYVYAFAGSAVCLVMGVSGDLHMATALPLVLVLAFVFALHFLTARACKNDKPWGRKASIALSVLMLFGFPVGTLVGIYLLVNTWKPWEAADKNVALQA